MRNVNILAGGRTRTWFWGDLDFISPLVPQMRREAALEIPLAFWNLQM
jgi:hypothetical protein